MDFTLDDEQRMLADTVERFVGAEYGFESRRARLGLAPGFSEHLWTHLAAMGLFALNVPPAHGGIGGGPVDTLIVMERLGRGLVLEPYLCTGVVAPRMLARFGSAAQQARWLPGIAEGSTRFALAAVEPQARFDLNEVRTTAVRTNDGFVLNGAKAVVPHGDSAHWFIVPARTRGGATAFDGISVFIVDASAEGVQRQGFATLDHRRVAEVVLKDVHLDSDALIGKVDHGWPVLEWTVDQALAALAAEAVGAMDRLTELTCTHLRDRVQFGKPIGTFQSLQHRAADMRIAVEQARALALMAAAAVDSPDRTERRRGASAAKAMAGRCGRFVGQQATQLHGGMGMTDEMPCGHYFKRLTAIDMTLGNAEHHVERYGEFLR